eukprot:TRINITY_DN14801_c0_g1_i1.p1 TRINITY_DN14801_c0_g1~~TRINITY_DN14801_c0_g1_i1.p1  ORF type:complete len:439 (-),score=65.44 TRINITY_DN14801_c0_g1_i1:180-1451(-)
MSPFALPMPKRMIMTLLCAFATFFSYLLRVVISMEILHMGDEYGWDERQRGIALSSFFYGYIVSQLPGGWWSVKYGGKRVLGFGVLSFSIASIFTAFFADWGIGALVVVRSVGGLGAGVIFPSISCLLGRWLPTHERSRLNSIAHAGTFVGAVVAFSLTPMLSLSYGWRFPFYFYGVLGISWWFVFNTLAADTPETHRSIEAIELNYIGAHNSQGKTQVAPPSFSRIFSLSPIWAIITCHFCNNWNHYVLISWLPTYLQRVYEVDSKQSGFFSVLPYTVTFVVSLSAGWLGDRLVASGWTITSVRKLFQTVAFLTASVFMLMLMSAPNVYLAVLYICGALGAASLSSAGFLTSPLDVAPYHAGIVLGISNTFATIPGIVGVAVVGWILQYAENAWNIVFGISIAFYMIGVTVWNMYITGERLF